MTVRTAGGSVTVHTSGEEVFRDGAFGNGQDGDVTISGTTTLTRDMFYDNLTITSSGVLVPAGFRVFVKNVLSNAGTIRRNGNDASGPTGGAVLGGGTSISMSDIGNAGPNGGAGAGTAGTAGRYGGAGGAGGAGAGGTGGAGGANSGPGSGGSHRAAPNSLIGIAQETASGGNMGATVLSCASGGAGGGGGLSSGGGGGGGAGTIMIAARVLDNSAGTISAVGGAGGTGAGGAGGNAGGGGGGAGGVVLLTYSKYLAGTLTVAGGAGGAASGGTGVAGSAGTAGQTTLLQVGPSV